MFTLLAYVGPAIITYLVVHKLSNKEIVFSMADVLELFVYAILDTIATILLLEPWNFVNFYVYNIGVHELYYKKSGFILCMILAALMGVAITFVLKRIKLDIEVNWIDEESEENDSEVEEN